MQPRGHDEYIRSTRHLPGHIAWCFTTATPRDTRDSRPHCSMVATASKTRDSKLDVLRKENICTRSHTLAHARTRNRTQKRNNMPPRTTNTTEQRKRSKTACISINNSINNSIHNGGLYLKLNSSIHNGGSYLGEIFRAWKSPLLALTTRRCTYLQGRGSCGLNFFIRGFKTCFGWGVGTRHQRCWDPIAKNTPRIQILRHFDKWGVML